MRKLTVAQWIAFISSSISIIVDMFASNPELFGVSNRTLMQIVVGVTMIKLLYDNYVSFSEQNMIEFGNEMIKKESFMMSKGSDRQTVVTDADLENYKLLKKK